MPTPSPSNYSDIPVEAIREAIELLKQGENLRAETKLATLQQQYPHNIHVQALYADTKRKLGHHKEAIASYRLVLEGGLRDPEVVLDFVQSLLQEKEFDEADTLVDEILAKESENTKALKLKGDILNKKGGPLAALSYYRKALDLQPGNVSLYRVISVLDTFSADSPVFKVLPKALALDIKDDRERAGLLATLAKAYLDIGEDSLAFQYYRQANKAVNHSLPPIRQELEQRLAYTRFHYTKALYNQLAAHGEQTRPQIIVAGMSRSGKSLVESLFRGVEGVTLTGETKLLSDYHKQVLANYNGSENQWLAFQTPELVRDNAAGYLKQLQALNDQDTIRITTMPGDIWNLGLIGLWAPNVPIIFCVRDVLDLAITGYFQQYQNPEGYRYSYDLNHMGRQIAIFEKLMEHWAQVLPNPIYLVDYEAVVRDPQTVMNNLLAQLDLKRTQSYEGIINANAGLESCISPIASQDAAMPITSRFIGISQRFKAYLNPTIEGYQEIIEQFPRQEPPATFSVALPDVLQETSRTDQHTAAHTDFIWQFKGQIKVIDNGGVVLQNGLIHKLLELNAFSTVMFDPGTELELSDDLRKNDALQLITGTTLGDGQKKIWHTFGTASCNGTLALLPATNLPRMLRKAGDTQWQEPIYSVALDDLANSEALEWLILRAGYDTLSILQHGAHTLADTLLVHINIAIQPTWLNQPSLDQITNWAQEHGYRLHKLLDQTMMRAIEDQTDLPHPPEPSELWAIGILLVPSDQRLATMTDNQLWKLAFILHSVYQTKDLAYSIIKQLDKYTAEEYLKAGNIHHHESKVPGNAALKKLGTDLKAGKVHQHLTLIRSLEKGYPENPQVLMLVAQKYSWLGANQSAMKTIQHAMELSPEDIYIRQAAIEILLNCGLWWEANQTARALLVKQPDNLDTMQLVAQALAADPIPNIPLIHATIDILKQILDGNEGASTEDTTDSKNTGNPSEDPLSKAAYVSTKARLHARVGQFDQALDLHTQALEIMGPDIQGPRRAGALINQADSLFETGKIDDSCQALWQACCCYPYSPITVRASISLNQRLAKCQDPVLNKLAVLHNEIQEIWSEYKKENLKSSFGDFGLPYQAFEPLMLPGTRPAMHRLGIYGLDQDLPHGARALDIGCNHGYLLMGLAPKLSYGLGFDISQSCIDVGNAVGKYLGHQHIELSSKPFDDFVCEEAFDLVIACAVHHWIGVPLTEFGAKLHSYCKPNGIVLLESQGTRKTNRVEPNFEEKASTIASAGFEVIRKGSLCDDSINYREFWILRKIAE
ncbi:sulfotransferase [Castellaniella sp.]|uniref:sulfotransferase n=1 Tax=Castellaniella sp. TaxID=1955812 RepID=UPI003C721D74